MKPLSLEELAAVIQQRAHAGGMQRPTLDHRDRDFLKTFKFAGATMPVFPDSYDTDAGVWMPNQSAVNPEFPNDKPQPFGCTNFTSADLSTDLNYVVDKILRNPALLEALTRANENGGYQLRDSLLAAKKIGWISGFYNITPARPFDYFDSIRLASFSGLPEKRSVSIGTPWYMDWAIVAAGVEKDRHGSYIYPATGEPEALMPMPADLSYEGVTWHNWAIKGWEMHRGQPWLRAKPWMGKDVGRGGYVFFDRATINAVMGIKWSIAFTATMQQPEAIFKINLAIIDRIASFIKRFLESGVPKTPTPVVDLLPEVVLPEAKPVEPTPEALKWGTKAEVRHSVRVICDDMGMTFEQKDTMCATIQGESNFVLTAKNENKRNGVTVSTDWGLCQINDYYHIGAGKSFSSVDFVLNNPEAVVRWMGKQWLAGNRNWWIAYKNGSYRKYLTK